jgi:dihydroflavonol-4-reductase
VIAAVTGGTGFVGSHLVEALVRRGDSVRCLVRSEAKADRLGACPRVAGDLDDERALAALCQGAESVFHVAGLTAARDEAEFLRVNRDGTARVAGAARAAGARRLVLVSSLAVTGPAHLGRPVDEATAPRPVSAYGRSKLAGEEAVRESGVVFTIVRPPTVYGPRDRELLRVFRMARRGLAPLLGDGRQELSLVHAADLAQALIAAAVSDAASGRVYHAAGPEVVTQRALVEAIGAAVGRQVRVVPLPSPFVRLALRASGAFARLSGRTTLLSRAKADELLAPARTCTSAALFRDAGWSAGIPLSTGLVQTARWYEAEGWL